MLAENCCYWRHLMIIENMVRKGIFGELTYAECGYVHDGRGYRFKPDGTITWRGELARDFVGNRYPTHALGPSRGGVAPNALVEYVPPPRETMDAFSFKAVRTDI